MPKFGKTSLERKKTLHPDLQLILDEVIKFYDISILEGIRTTQKQQEYFHQGRSKLDGIHKKSKHQKQPDGWSHAVDIMPYRKGANAFSGKKEDIYRFYYLAGIMKLTAYKLYSEGKITHLLRWGGDWDSDDIYTDQNFNDLPHFELKKPS